jgi:deoxyribonuclease (pyrimidine dimer)
MTRINLVPVEELSDQHLIAEYHELPRIVKQKISIDGAPKEYRLGKGHMKWARLHLLFTLSRYRGLCYEMEHRGFTVNHKAGYLDALALDSEFVNEYLWLNYSPSEIDVKLSRDRLVEKIKQKPSWYKWTNREKPYYLRGK